MKAIVCTDYGSPDVLQLKEVEKPAPKDNEVLVRIHATTVTAAHTMMRKGVPYFGRLFTGLTRPKHAIPGTELAGVVEAVGKDVTHFKVGDQVFGATDLEGGCNAEYTCVPEDGVLAAKPANLGYGEVATMIDGALTSMHFLRDKGHIQRGQRVLINGASGSVGSAAVQLAKFFEAEVTGVCSTKNIELVKSLGADEVIDYTREDFTQSGQTYDIIFDAVGKSSFPQCKRSLKPQGVYLTTVAGLPAMAHTLWTSIVGGKKAVFGAAGLRPTKEKVDDLVLLKELIETRTMEPVIDRCYPLEQVADAHRYVDTGHKRGNIAITVA
ncbi:MAG: NAD(P)-dependent alcohol dehydrogenase [Caldilineaceae bacterium]|nr:NAD(P)-dependent alcohol dehydrogenase [Caldilineaceae bacterium]